MLASTKDLHDCTLGGRTYWFRTPGVYDLPKMRRVLRKQGVRRPDRTEMRICAQIGIRRVAEAGGWPEGEGDRQADVIGQWYELMTPPDENLIDEVDLDKRAAILAQLEAARQAEIAALYPEVLAIEAALERHWPAYADLAADATYWDELSRIDAVRVLIERIDDAQVRKDGEGLAEQAAYLAIPPEHRLALGTFALALLAPSETQRKN